MQTWFRISLLLCTFGFLKELRPSEPFIVDYLTGRWTNYTTEQIYQYVFPVGTYSYLAHIILIFLITDFFCYKPLIIICGLSGVIVWSLLSWKTSWEALITLEFFYGTFMATEVAYYTYIYAKVDKDHYQQVTSHTRAAVLAGRFLGSVLGQILVFTELMDYKQLNYISFGALITATLWAFLLPAVPRSLYFHQSTRYNTFQIKRTSNHSNTDIVSSSVQKLDSAEVVAKVTYRQKIRDGLKLLWSHFISAYSQNVVVHWSIWYALAMAGFMQVQAYIQVLWQDIEPNLEQTAVWNGAIEALLTICGALGALLAGRIKIGALHYGLLTLTVCSLLGGGVILLAALTTTLWLSYFGYVTFGVLYMFMITYASSEIAKHLIEDSFGLIFGINTMVALVFQTILTVTVLSDGGFNLLPRGQFLVYGFYFVVLGALYFIAAIVSYFKRQKINEVQTLTID